MGEFSSPEIQIKEINQRREATKIATFAECTFVDKFGHLYAQSDLDHFIENNHRSRHYEALIDNPRFNVWGTYDGRGDLIAYAVAGECRLPVDDLEETAGEIKRIYVAGDGQSRGIGTALMHEMLTWMKNAGFAPIYLSVFSENYGAIRFYERYKFKIIKKYEFMVGNHPDPEFIMKLSQQE